MLKKLIDISEQFLFPRVCLACSGRLSSKELYICESCLKKRYTDPNPEKNKTCEGILLPDTVYFQDALWRFDSGGSLQELLHNLKYTGVGKIGIILGELLGKKVKLNPGFQLWKENKNEILITSVPLHPKKYRIRGYNQAHKIAIGVSAGLEEKLLGFNGLNRTRYTETQTHFTHEERIKNMQDVFVADTNLVNGKCILVVDDVFTTGATSYACAEALITAGAKSIGIITIAVA
jgi:ComF family protein